MRNFPARNILLGTLAVMTVAVVRFVLPELRQEPALFYQSESVSVPDGTLIRVDGDERVYYAAAGVKRWVDSERTFQAHGFRAEDIRTLTPEEMAQYPEGEPITVLTRLVLPGEASVLPDLAPLAPYSLHLATVNGRRVIRFTGSFWNKGRQPFFLASRNEMIVSGAAEGSQDVYQRVLSSDGATREKYVGTFAYHPAHRHQHFSDFAEYLLEPASTVPGSSGLSSRQKTTFCMRDDERMPADIPNVPAVAVFTVCGNTTQAVSPGWIDVYSWTLPDQYVDVHDAPPGVYALSFSLDPMKRFIEARGDNDIATTLVELDVSRGVLRVIASLAPFETVRNFAVDGTLLSNAENGNVYVVQQGRKRWLRSVDVFVSYGSSWSAVYPVTAAMIDAFPDQRLIRQQGTASVYVLSEQGYRRHILSPDVFASYGWTSADVMDINGLDFASYPESELIMRSGDTEVYSIKNGVKRPFGTLAALQAIGHDLRGLHLVNQADFDSYADVSAGGNY